MTLAICTWCAKPIEPGNAVVHGGSEATMHAACWQNLAGECKPCASMPTGKACLEHTCPDCGWVYPTNDHPCLSPSSDY